MERFVQLTSRENQKLKFVREVRDGRRRDLLFVEGLRLVEEGLGAGLTYHSIYFEEGIIETDRLARIVDQTRSNVMPAFEIPQKVFRTISDTENSQGLVLIAYAPQNGAESIDRNLHSGRFPIVTMLTEINNPSNLGAVLRTTEAVGAAGVIVTKDSADPFSPKALRASMGSAFRLPVWSGADFDEAIQWAKERKLTATGADIRAKVAYDKIDWKIPRLLILGSEAHGLDPGKLKVLDDSIFIPMEKPVESLNLAVSTGVILFEAKRQVEL